VQGTGQVRLDKTCGPRCGWVDPSWLDGRALSWR